MKSLVKMRSVTGIRVIRADGRVENYGIAVGGRWYQTLAFHIRRIYYNFKADVRYNWKGGMK